MESLTGTLTERALEILHGESGEGATSSTFMRSYSIASNSTNYYGRRQARQDDMREAIARRRALRECAR